MEKAEFEAIDQFAAATRSDLFVPGLSVCPSPCWSLITGRGGGGGLQTGTERGKSRFTPMKGDRKGFGYVEREGRDAERFRPAVIPICSSPPPSLINDRSLMNHLG